MLILVRGPSGSGKSTFAKDIMKKMTEASVVHYESDDFFLNSKGEYIFNPKALGDAHDWNRHRTRRALKEGLTVIVSNTLTRLWEMQQYLSVASELKVPVMVYRMTTRYQNTHGVPEDKVQAMWDRMEDYPEEILV